MRPRSSRGQPARLIYFGAARLKPPLALAAIQFQVFRVCVRGAVEPRHSIALDCRFNGLLFGGRNVRQECILLGLRLFDLQVVAREVEAINRCLRARESTWEVR